MGLPSPGLSSQSRVETPASAALEGWSPWTMCDSQVFRVQRFPLLGETQASTRWEELME